MQPTPQTDALVSLQHDLKDILVEPCWFDHSSDIVIMSITGAGTLAGKCVHIRLALTFRQHSESTPHRALSNLALLHASMVSPFPSWGKQTLADTNIDLFAHN